MASSSLSRHSLGSELSLSAIASTAHARVDLALLRPRSLSSVIAVCQVRKATPLAATRPPFSLCAPSTPPTSPVQNDTHIVREMSVNARKIVSDFSTIYIRLRCAPSGDLAHALDVCSAHALWRRRGDAGPPLPCTAVGGRGAGAPTSTYPPCPLFGTEDGADAFWGGNHHSTRPGEEETGARLLTMWPRPRLRTFGAYACGRDARRCTSSARVPTAFSAACDAAAASYLSDYRIMRVFMATKASWSHMGQDLVGKAAPQVKHLPAACAIRDRARRRRVPAWRSPFDGRKEAGHGC
ncbi:hypothetical protein VTO73DRAFT_13908 [Trametes versicolor]